MIYTSVIPIHRQGSLLGTWLTLNWFILPTHMAIEQVIVVTHTNLLLNIPLMTFLIVIGLILSTGVSSAFVHRTRCNSNLCIYFIYFLLIIYFLLL